MSEDQFVRHSREERQVALITNVLSHYRVSCFQSLYERLNGYIDFFFLTETMSQRHYVLADGHPPFPSRVLPGWSIPYPPFDDLHLNDIRPLLHHYDLLIIAGWSEPTFLMLWMLAHIRHIPVAFWIESTLHEQSRGGWKELLKRILLRGSMGTIVPGQNSIEYCKWLGMPSDRIFLAPNAVDVVYFRRQAKNLLAMRESLRRDLGLTGVVILFVGRMVESFKGVSVLIQAHQQLIEQKLDSHLVLIGEGPDRANYEQYSRNVPDVQFDNFMNHDSLCRYYAAADIFVLPSRSEPWGFVLNEAMEFGLPLVTTDAVGAAPDLIVEGENGFVVPVGNPDTLALVLKRLVGDVALRERMGTASQKRITLFTPERWAVGMAHAIEAITS